MGQPFLTPAYRNGQLVSGAVNILLFNKSGKLGAREIPFIYTEQSMPESGAAG